MKTKIKMHFYSRIIYKYTGLKYDWNYKFTQLEVETGLEIDYYIYNFGTCFCLYSTAWKGTHWSRSNRSCLTQPPDKRHVPRLQQLADAFSHVVRGRLEISWRNLFSKVGIALHLRRVNGNSCYDKKDIIAVLMLVSFV